MKMKKAWCIALAAAMTFMSVMPAFAADKKIDTVKLTFSYDTCQRRLYWFDPCKR